ncbi:hypothetical protein BDV41DRAFT_527665 [Aspergillus transmontanensis]|uniref:Uncharacterized protein n=1 Tax=Aspergillus transmontanensis TaxID=1034304 RepID=A0A5N6W817_9EURO|nr:hypothetical protein BDV41DRAFT_527665 [Aspergillus transmontanensis]
MGSSSIICLVFLPLGPVSPGLKGIASNGIIPSAFSISQLIGFGSQVGMRRIITQALFIIPPPHGRYASMAKKCLSKRSRQ